MTSLRLEDGVVLRNIHPEALCDGLPCAIHHPSSHHMNQWPQGWKQFLEGRANRGGYITRICEHGNAHPDPDSIHFLVAHGVIVNTHHDCCEHRCCRQ